MQLSRKGLYIGALLVIVTTTIIAFVIRSMHITPQSIIDQQVSAIRQQKIELAYSLTSDEFKNATTQDEFADFIKSYPALAENKSIECGKFFQRKDMESATDNKDTIMSVECTLQADKNVTTPIEYTLIKSQTSKNKWLVMGMDIKVPNTAPQKLTKKYDSTESRYTIQYPSSWEYEVTNDGTVIFSGRRGSPAYFSTVNIQTVLTLKSGGDFKTVAAFMADIKQQAKNQSPNVKFLEQGPIQLFDKGIGKEKGEYAIFTYRFKGQDFKQWQVVVLRDDGQVFYAWAYTAPVKQYDDNVAVAKAMLESWVIY